MTLHRLASRSLSGAWWPCLRVAFRWVSMEVRLDLNLLAGDAIGLWDVPGSERDSNEAKLTTDCLFKLRLGAVGRDMRRKGR